MKTISIQVGCAWKHKLKKKKLPKLQMGVFKVEALVDFGT